MPVIDDGGAPDLVPVGLLANDVMFINADGDEVHRVQGENTVAYIINRQFFYSVDTGKLPIEYVLYGADGKAVDSVSHPPVAVSDRKVAVYIEDMTAALRTRGVVGLPYKAEGSEIGWVESAGVLFLDLEDGVWVVLDVDDDYREVRRFEDVGISWKLSEQLVRIYERDDDGVARSWVMGHDFQRVSPPNIDIRSGPTGPFYAGEDLSEDSVRLQVFEMNNMLFDLPNNFIKAYVFASGLVWAETFEDGYVFSNSGDMLERREGWEIKQVTTPCNYALFSIKGESGVFVANEDIEIIAHYPGVAGLVGVTEDGYVHSANGEEPYRIYDQTGNLIWEDVPPKYITPTP